MPKKTEILQNCPVCHQTGFTQRGLRAHHGTDACNNRLFVLQGAIVDAISAAGNEGITNEEIAERLKISCDIVTDVTFFLERGFPTKILPLSFGRYILNPSVPSDSSPNSPSENLRKSAKSADKTSSVPSGPSGPSVPSVPSSEIVVHSCDTPEFEGENTHLIPVPSVDQQMGEQYTRVYRGVISGMRDIVILAGMTEEIQSRLSARVRTRTQAGTFDDKGEGFRAWLAEFAPEVKAPTIYRFLAVAEAVKAEFKLPAAVQKKLGWSKFVTATPAELALIDPSFAPKQQELWTFVEGTSQRSWLDRLRPKKPLGGRRERDPNKPERDPNDPEAEALDLWTPLLRDLAQEGLIHKSWMHLPRKTLIELDGLLTDLKAAIKGTAK